MGESQPTGLSEWVSMQAPPYGNLPKHHSQDKQESRTLGSHPWCQGAAEALCCPPRPHTQPV